jgi:hypothetical protein
MPGYVQQCIIAGRLHDADFTDNGIRALRHIKNGGVDTAKNQHRA